ncbi:hypothetical protein PTI98_004035 [Pleurotus ostreatus]|nr:hypothetical protein PTI98_004035 [Pleurotus ostreatus]
MADPGTSSTVPCPICGMPYKQRGLNKHMASCKLKKTNRAKDTEFLAKEKLRAAQEILKARNRNQASSTSQITSLPPAVPAPNESLAFRPLDSPLLYHHIHPRRRPWTFTAPGSTAIAAASRHPDRRLYLKDSIGDQIQPQIDDIKCNYHPSSQRPTTVHHFHEYGLNSKAQPDYIIDDEPWRPFRTRRDFEFASIALTQSLNENAVDTLLELTYGAVGRDPSRGALTLQSYKEMMNIWKLAANKMPGFTQHSVSDVYKGKVLSYDVWRRPVWDWVMKLVQDPRLAPHFEWDAKQLFKFDGKSWIRFRDDIVTGDLWWEIQSTLPNDGKPFILIIYADKTRLSTFGTAKGYPVIARVGNLNINIRNGEGPGGGFMVGWLPIIEELAPEKGKTKWTNHKATIYHLAMGVILEDIIAHSHTGFAVKCGDGVQRSLYPCVPIKSADYEEDCVMTLTRGTGSYCPCPICLVPEDKLAIHDTTYPLRTQATMKKVYDDAMAMRTVEESNNLLKNYGLRGIDNVFWKIANSDPYRSTSFDCLHTFDGGLFDDHLFKQILLHVDALGRKSLTALDNQMMAFPRWSRLGHFKAITTLSFNDGSKSEDISKCILFAAHNILTRQVDHAGYILLKCMRHYINLRMYASLQVHTSETISAGREEVKQLSLLLQEYQEKTKPEFRKSWNFPKNHLYVHLFDDIEQKGATRNYSTKPYEKSHGGLKTTYRRRTNFKNIAPQILLIDHLKQVSDFIWDEINVLDASKKLVAPTPAPEDEDAEDDDVIASPSGHYSLGSRDKPITLADVEANHQGDAAFERFRLRLVEFLNRELDVERQPGHRYLRNPGDQLTKIHPGKYLTVNYESTVDWREDTDLLRCNPKFQGAPRYDHVIIKTARPTTLGTDIVAQLLMIFTITVNQATYDIALVHSLDRPSGIRQQKDIDLQLLRLRARPRKSAEFIFLSSILRGVLVVPDFGLQGDHFLVDTVDGDMFLRYRFL